jgi:hypothetical protein
VTVIFDEICFKTLYDSQFCNMPCMHEGFLYFKKTWDVTENYSLIIMGDSNGDTSNLHHYFIS